MSRLSFVLILFAFYNSGQAQLSTSFVDSIRVTYKIPELAYSVVSTEGIVEMKCLGYKRAHTNIIANLNDRFRIGSNTKTITSYITALLVKNGKIKWDTKFFDLFPELKAKSKKAYYQLTLKDLLTFRAPLISWTYTFAAPTKKEVDGNSKEQRYDFVAWVLQQNPVAESRIYYWSNPAYVMVGLMMEKVTGKSFEDLVAEFGEETGIQFGFGQPNYGDRNQPWGHDENLQPEEPALNEKLSWLSSAGNINVSLPDYSKFIRLQLQGLSGQNKTFTAEEFENMHYGLPEFSFGWRWYVDHETGFKYSFHEGNPGTFLSKTFVCNDTKKAFILFSNIQSDEAEKGLMILFAELKKKYGS